MKTPLKVAVLTLALSAINHPFVNCPAQGSLTPPGPPGPSMLTLSQVEPRTPVDAVHTGGGGGAEFIIVQPGSYYLTTNIVGVTGLVGINISANDVSLDLNGFSVQGTSGALDGIYLHSGWTNIVVRNGIISGWNNTSQYGIGVADYANNVVLEKLIITGCASNGVVAANGVEATGVQVLNCGASGFSVGPGSTVQNCTALGNGTYGFVANNNCIFKECNGSGNANTGIYALAYSNCVIENCTAISNGVLNVPVDGISIGGGVVRGCASANNASNGITAGNGCVIENCAVNANANGAPFAAGISAGNGCTIEHCTAVANGANWSYGGAPSSGAGIACAGGLIADCAVYLSPKCGISCGSGVVRDCQAQQNGYSLILGLQYGIFIAGSGTVSDCNISQTNVATIGIEVDSDGCQIIGNTVFGGGPAIEVDGNNCRVDGNQMDGSSAGVLVFSGTNNVIVRNSAFNGGANNYSIPGGNDVGPIGTAATATSPWANISH